MRYIKVHINRQAENLAHVGHNNKNIFFLIFMIKNTVNNKNVNTSNDHFYPIGSSVLGI